MSSKGFTIASRFKIQPSSNSVYDLLLQAESHLEPRVMKILCILAEHKEEVVSRELLVKEVWEEYGGGDEGLTQAISSLRKLLHDANKEIIETIPKKGYILHGAEMGLPVNAEFNQPKKEYPKRPVLYAIFLAMAAIGIAGFMLWKGKEVSLPSALAGKPESIQVPFKAVNGKFEESPANTITTIDENKTEYKLKVIGDQRPEFFINGRLLSPDEMENHLNLIYNLKKELQKRQAY